MPQAIPFCQILVTFLLLSLFLLVLSLLLYLTFVEIFYLSDDQRHESRSKPTWIVKNQEFINQKTQDRSVNGVQRMRRRNKSVSAHAQVLKSTARSSNASDWIVLALKISLGICVFLWILFLVIIPCIFRFWTSLHYSAVFAHIIDQNLNQYSEYHSKSLRNFLVENEDDLDASGEPIKLGVWYLPPGESQVRTEADSKLFQDTNLVILYVHGAGSTRGAYPRNALYKRLSNGLKAHIVAFDYRGFGDSSPVTPTAGGLVRDTRTMYHWILEQGVSPERVILWGHSLGSAVVIRMLSSERTRPLAAILEAPLTNLSEAIESSHHLKFFRPLPYFHFCFITPITTNPDINFNSLHLLPKVKCPLLVLHATDDTQIPIAQGLTLYRCACVKQPDGVRTRARFHRFKPEPNFPLDHSWLYRAKELITVVSEFIRELTS